MFGSTVRSDGFGNGRFARQVFQEMTERHAQRIADEDRPSKDDLSTLLPVDIPAATAVST